MQHENEKIMSHYINGISGGNERLSRHRVFCRGMAGRLFIFSIVIFAVAGIFASKSVASYLIELNSGTTFITDHYWDEGNQVKFNLYGGTAGFNKKLIKSINETNQVYEYEETELKNGQPGNSSPEKAPENGVVQEEAKAEIPAITEEQKAEFLRQKEAIVWELRQKGAAFKEAKERKDRKEMKAQREELLKSYDDIQTLFNEVKTANGGEPPEWWPSTRDE
jgi:hypothetical protein